MSFSDEMRTEQGIINFTGNLETVISGNPERFNLDAARATAYATTRSAFMEAYGVYHTEATHSTPYRVAKDTAKQDLRNSTRDLCEQFLANRSIDAGTLALVGLKRRSGSGTPVKPPTTAPFVMGQVDSATAVTLSFRNAEDPDRRAKPAGVRQVAVAQFVGDAPPANTAEWGQPILLGRTSKQLTFNTQTPLTVWITAWWITSRNETSQASAPVSFRIAGTSGALPQQQADRPTMKIAA
jgi:hypothetical protein